MPTNPSLSPDQRQSKKLKHGQSVFQLAVDRGYFRCYTDEEILDVSPWKRDEQTKEVSIEGIPLQLEFHQFAYEWAYRDSISDSDETQIWRTCAGYNSAAFERLFRKEVKAVMEKIDAKYKGRPEQFIVFDNLWHTARVDDQDEEQQVMAAAAHLRVSSDVEHKVEKIFDYVSRTGCPIQKKITLLWEYPLFVLNPYITMSNHDGNEAVAIRRYQHALKENAHKDICKWTCKECEAQGIATNNHKWRTRCMKCHALCTASHFTCLSKEAKERLDKIPGHAAWVRYKDGAHLVDGPAQQNAMVYEEQEGLVSWNDCIKEHHEEAYRVAAMTVYDIDKCIVQPYMDWSDFPSQQLDLCVLHLGFNYLFSNTKWSLQKWAHERVTVNELLQAAFNIIITQENRDFIEGEIRKMWEEYDITPPDSSKCAVCKNAWSDQTQPVDLFTMEGGIDLADDRRKNKPRRICWGCMTTQVHVYGCDGSDSCVQWPKSPVKSNYCLLNKDPHKKDPLTYLHADTLLAVYDHLLNATEHPHYQDLSGFISVLRHVVKAALIPKTCWHVCDACGHGFRVTKSVLSKCFSGIMKIQCPMAFCKAAWLDRHARYSVHSEIQTGPPGFVQRFKQCQWCYTMRLPEPALGMCNLMRCIECGCMANYANPQNHAMFNIKIVVERSRREDNYWTPENKKYFYGLNKKKQKDFMEKNSINQYDPDYVPGSTK